VLATDEHLRDLVSHMMVDFNQMKTFAENPLVLTEGSGVRVTDVNGRSYIDGLSGVFAVSLGHSATPVIDAMTSQLRRLTFSSPIMSTNDRALELVGELIDLTGGRMQCVKLLNSGSESTEAAMKMARQYHQQTGQGRRFKIISFYRAYHGATMGALSATGWPRQRSPYEPLAPGFVHAPPPICDRNPATHDHDECLLRCAHAVREIIMAEGPETVAAFILEPVMLTAGVRVLPRAFLQEIREICDDLGVLLIYDEIVTGFGRLGSWFSAELHDVWPDFLCVGKGISSGYAPLSAVLMTEPIRQAFWGEARDNLQFQAGHTHAGNPVSAAAGVATIRTIRETGVLENVKRSGARLQAHLVRLREENRYVADVRGLGLLYCIDFMQDRNRWQPFPDGLPVATAVQAEARRRGLLLRASPLNATLAPPLVTSEAEVDEIANILGDAIAEVSRVLQTQGRLAVEVGFGL
jgi:adenosylmethionine-8-amino-7-oxononanoate aminotransferase